MTATDLNSAVSAFYRAGLSIVPPKEDGTKAPIGTWKEYEEIRATQEQVQEWYKNGRRGVGAVFGAVSGNLEMFEFDERSVYERFIELAGQFGLSDLVERIVTGYEEETPGGGTHWLYKCAIVGSNTKLARRPKKPEEMQHPEDNIKTLIETRGEGGFGILAPSCGNVHPSGKPYVLLSGGPDTIAVITLEERESLWSLARLFDEMPKKQFAEQGRQATSDSNPSDEDRPGDIFNQTASWEATGIYASGWRRAFEHGGTTYLRRPGKVGGISATINYAGSDLLYVFTTSTQFDSERGYSKFSVYALLNHNGDFKAAARELADRGYRSPKQKAAHAGFDEPPLDDAYYQDYTEEQPAHKTNSTQVKSNGLIRLSDVLPERVSWLWQERIPGSKLTLLDGDPGLGKTTIALDVAARVSTGDAMPDGTWGDYDGPAGVLLMSAEDGLADTIRPRLDAAGADCSRIVARQMITESSGLMRMPSLADLSQMEMDIATVGARLVIIDPVMAYLPSTVKSHVDADVRRVLAPLAELAERTGVAIVILRHLNKAAGGNPLYRGGGSIAFIGAVRSGLLAARDPDDETGNKFVLAPLKANLGKRAQPLAYHIEGLENGASRIVWDGPSNLNADELLNDSDSEERGALADAIAFLKDILEQGPTRASDVHKAADTARIASRTLRRAKDRLHVRAERVGAITDAHWQWSLPRE